MASLVRFAKNAYVTIAPQSDQLPPCGSTRFRWGTHISLPFTLPSRACIHRKICLGGRDFEYSIHNFLDRLTVFPSSQPSLPSVYLIERSQPTPSPQSGERFTREVLQSVASFVESVESGSSEAAFRNAAEKIDSCFQFLSDHLSNIQASLPYLASWQVYPVSRFDVGLVYHGVEHFCLAKSRWEHFQSGVRINVARQLHQPLSLFDFSKTEAVAPPVNLSNELLAEAQVSLFRGLSRSAILNSYQAVESLANAVFKAKQSHKLVSDGMTPSEAEAKAEELRLKHRVDIKFLVHYGLVQASAESLCNDQKNKYDDLCNLNQLRHRVAHAGAKPSFAEAEAAHCLCCEVVQWLCEKGNYPVRPLLPDPQDMPSDLASISSDINAVPGASNAFLLWVLGEAPKQELFATNCQHSLKIGVHSAKLVGTEAESEV